MLIWMHEAQLEVLLGRTELFRGLPDHTRRAVAGRARVRRYARGQLIWSADDPAEHLIILAEGRLKVLVRSADGDEVLLAVAEPGQSLGEVALADGGRRSATVEVLERAVVVTVAVTDLLDLVRQDAELAVRLVQRLAAVIRRLTDTTADLVFLDLPGRMAKLLLAGPPGTEITGSVDRDELAGFTQSELAQLVGATRQSVNAVLMSWQRRGWVSVAGRAVHVRDRAALRRLLPW